MIKKLALGIAGAAGVALAALLAYAATRPDTFSIQRSVRIQAPAEKVYPLIADLHRFNTWNPFDKKDPQIKGSYRGPASGPGSAYDFAGNNEVGKGSLTVTGLTAPRQVTMRLDMSEPMAASNDIAFTLVPQGDATEVTWAMRGASPYLAKVMHVVFDIDRMVGGDFEKGLASLKALAERP
jgi:uncharacterized protein YndB with AHSA1/START domain